ncbi:hypothetical protein EDD76_10331 [Kineothrix alysoides]|uniref:DUF3021 family protein n=1 Tax=Kineothrix alysoides TaxID=1469948 RepID=A0A4R1R356_9FIRM|nr:hypothetical protein [Kineothrix alysoides]TCL59844.1 hypothetical protein EDD76_10331 [Kineothrix alysoides]
MYKIQTFLIMNFTIYAVLVLLQALLHLVGITEDFNSVIVSQYFILSSLLAVVELCIRTFLRFKSSLCQMIASTASVLPIVLFMGGVVLHWFSLKAKWIVLCTVITISIEIILYFITGMFSAKRAAEQINRVIRQKKEEKS